MQKNDCYSLIIRPLFSMYLTMQHNTLPPDTLIPSPQTLSNFPNLVLNHRFHLGVQLLFDHKKVLLCYRMLVSKRKYIREDDLISKDILPACFVDLCIEVGIYSTLVVKIYFSQDLWSLVGRIILRVQKVLFLCLFIPSIYVLCELFLSEQKSCVRASL